MNESATLIREVSVRALEKMRTNLIRIKSNKLGQLGVSGAEDGARNASAAWLRYTSERGRRELWRFGLGGEVLAVGIGDSSVSQTGQGQSDASRKTWWVATGLLILMAALFLSTHVWRQDVAWLQAVRAFSEAAMVGALADWFAVTALFRYPLGIPIPHTAIIPSNKGRIGRSLGQFVQSNFLSPEVLEGEAVNISGAVARWLSDPGNRKRILRRVRALVPRMLENIEEGELRAFLDKQVEEIIGRIDLAKTSGCLLRLLTSNDMHELVLDEVVRQTRSFFRANQDWFRGQLRDASPWFVPDFVDKRIFEAILTKTEDTFTQALTDRNHELRRRVHDAVRSFIARLETSPEAQRKGEEIRAMLLANDVFRGYVNSVRDGLLEEIKADIRSDGSRVAEAIERILTNFVMTMSASEELQQRLNKGIRGALQTLAGEQGGHVADLIARTIDSWDSSTIVSKLEEQVGPDLQYIRINGTIVGGLVGLLLYLVERILT